MTSLERRLATRKNAKALCIPILLLLLFATFCFCTGCGSKHEQVGNKQGQVYEHNGMKFDFHNQPYIMAHVRGTIISVQPKGEQTDVKIKPQMFELMQNAKEKSPEVDYRNKEIVLEVMRPPEGLEQGKTLDAEVRVVHSADNVVRFLGVSVRVI